MHILHTESEEVREKENLKSESSALMDNCDESILENRNKLLSDHRIASEVGPLNNMREFSHATRKDD